MSVTFQCCSRTNLIVEEVMDLRVQKHGAAVELGLQFAAHAILAGFVNDRAWPRNPLDVIRPAEIINGAFEPRVGWDVLPRVVMRGFDHAHTTAHRAHDDLVALARHGNGSYVARERIEALRVLAHGRELLVQIMELVQKGALAQIGRVWLRLHWRRVGG
jgi:hypothetical protein